MRNRDTFSGYHPVVNFLYFTEVLLFSMFFMHPACLAISLVSGAAYAAMLYGGETIWKNLKFMLPVFLLAALLNPLFNHEGATLLWIMPGGKVVTLESILYGLAAGAMLVSVLLWFRSYNLILTSDKFVYLFGRIIPALSLVLTMALRFVPRLKTQFSVVSEAQRCVGRDISQGKGWQKARNAMAIFSILMTWALENAIDTADSMKSRGYGLPGRSTFSIYRFDSRDGAALAWLLFSGAYVLLGSITGGLTFSWFPVLAGAEPTAFSVSFFLVYLGLCLTPVIIDGYSNLAWRRKEAAER